MSGSLRSALVLTAILIVVGKITGFLRDVVMAFTYGADKATDAFFVANVVPSICLIAFYSTIPLAFIPFYIRKLENAGSEAAGKYASAMLWFYLGVTLAITVFTMATAGWFVGLLAPQFDAPTTARAVELVRIFTISFVFSTACAFLSAIQYAHNVHLGQQLSPLINNTIVIVALLLYGRQFGITFAAAAIVFGWVVQLPVQAYFSRRYFKPMLSWSVTRSDLSTLAAMSAPVFLTLFIEQGLAATTAYFASAMDEGAVSVMNYANKLANLPLTLGTLLITVYIYPVLSRYAARDDIDGLKTYFISILKVIAWLAVPVVAGCAMRGDIVSFLAYGHSKLAATEVEAIGRIFSLLVVGIFFLLLREIFNRCFYTLGMGMPVVALTALLIVCTVVFCMMLAPRLQLEGLAIAVALAAFIAFAVQAVVLNRIIGLKGTGMRFPAACVAGLAAMLAILFAEDLFWPGLSYFARIPIAALSGAAYIAVSLLLGGRPWSGIAMDEAVRPAHGAPYRASSRPEPEQDETGERQDAPR